MRSAYLNGSDGPTASARRRSAALALTVAAHLLIVLLLLRLGPSPSPPRERPRPPAIFQMLPPPPPTPEKAIAEEPVVAEAGGSQARAPDPVPKAAAAAPAAPAPPTPFILMPGGAELFDAADIGKLPSRSDDRIDGGDGAGAGTARNSASVYGPGEGPGGERLYDVDWVRRPTDAELSPYLPVNRPSGSWAIIACRMLEGNRVENCRALSESPPGSGLARGLRLAAWQFRVLPPRIGNRKVLGGWVRIRMDFVDRPPASDRR